MRSSERGTRSAERGVRRSDGVMLKHNLGLCALISAALVGLVGCNGFFHRGGSAAGPGAIQNPLFIPPVDREFLWNQTVDAVDDYFRIEREDRVRLIGGVLTEGRIDTF